MRWCQTRHECDVIGITPHGSPQNMGDRYRITPRSRAKLIDTHGLSTAGLKHRDQGLIRRGYSVDRLQRSDGRPMGGPPLCKLQSTVTSVARCDYGPPPLARPKLKIVTRVAFYRVSALSGLASLDEMVLDPGQQGIKSIGDWCSIWTQQTQMKTTMNQDRSSSRAKERNTYQA